ncbi:MAG TPA: hypothetical protein VMS22_08385 [Candidatus Eisenbacteria bacterium]|nr:hypothetical protein [Candidatus Eisenbacteria bacterium]
MIDDASGEVAARQLPSALGGWEQEGRLLLGWWVPGSRDVVNDLEVVPFQADSDDEITDAVRSALDCRFPRNPPRHVRAAPRHQLVFISAAPGGRGPEIG